MLSNCDMSCKEKVELLLKTVFVIVFTYGVMNAVCCMKSCSSESGCSTKTSCSKTEVVQKDK